MSIELICPRCQTRLTVSDAARRQLTCPRCLAQLLNPHGVDPSNQTAPRPVIPLEQQVSRDQSLSQGALSAIIGLLAIGGMIMIAGMDLGAVGRILIIALLTASVAGLGMIGLRSKRESDALASEHGSIAGPPSIPGALPYRSTRDEDDGRTGLRFAGGFFTAIGVCAGCFILLAATVDFQPKSAHVLFLCIVLAAVIGLIVLTTSVRQNPSWRGFGPGVTVGLVLGMMALGPCGFCYLMTLG
jgi:cell division protein FtsW (lipid II flippase)